MSESAPSFELVFRPCVELISVVRRFVAEFYEKTLDDMETASRLALTTHELLENAAKYSLDGETNLSVKVDRKDHTVFVRTTNRATSEQVQTLQAWFDEIGRAEDAEALYAQMIRRTAALKTGSGGLGLARVWAESEMAIELGVDGDRVEIRALGKLPTTR